LDYAVSYANIRRIAASKTYTPLEVTGIVGSIVPLGTIVDVADVGTRFLFTEALTLTNTQFADITITTSSVVDSTNYSITVNS
ncbi:baseplate J/gp47 family protein, partial [Pseudoflavonifractor capillosus]|uniref:baseplate J/gp47 family protein n=1 Tax=Pseudoflavonifractor capillosus TaxID=106588 RepID=UPI00195CD1FA